MRKINSLIKNEFIKQYKKVSTKIILILILVSAVALPFAVKALSERENNHFYLESYKEHLSYIENTIKSLDSKTDKGSQLQKLYLEAEKTQVKMTIDNNINYNDWRQDSTHQWLDKEIEAITIKAIIDGYDETTILENGRFRGKENGNGALTVYYQMPKEEVQKALDKTKKASSELKDSIEKNDFMKYLDKSISSLKDAVTSNKDMIKVLEEKIKSEPKNEQAKNELEQSKKQLEITEERLKATQYRYDNKVPYDDKDWRNLTIKDLAMNAERKGQKLSTEEEFKQQNTYEISQGLTYEDYKKNYEDNQQKVKEAIELDWYSLKNNIPQVKFANDARNMVDNLYLMYVSVVIVLCIIIAGGIVSSEYSTGTVRLLMIRPVSRWKFLLSKLLTVFIIGYSTLILSVLMIVLSSGALLGFGGFATKVLTYSNGAIVQQNYLLSMIPKLLFSSISLIFIVSVAFMLSTVVKNTALAVGLTTVLYLGSSPATFIMARLKMKWVANTVLPYMNLSSFYGDSFTAEMLKNQFNIILDKNFGAMQLAVLAAVLIGISFAVFTKRDVK